MIVSMTGFGSGAAAGAEGRVKVELRSVNSRFCDVQIRCPPRIQRFEAGIRTQLRRRIGRGKITVFVDWEEVAAGSPLPTLDEELARHYLAELERLRAVGGLDGRPDLALVAGLPGLFKSSVTTPEPEAVEQLLAQAVDVALDDFVRMCAREGQALARDLRARVIKIQETLERVEAMAGEARQRIQGRLRERVETLLRPGEVDEDRLAQEVVMLAERSDITEEVVRFHSHNAQFLDTLDQGGEVGRRLNFLLQEMNREVNTISSKSHESEIVHLAVGIKEEVERLREQVQNLA
jgi:uncharacterized protein (TIGR00255 family)